MKAEVNDKDTFRTIDITFYRTHPFWGTYTSIVYHSSSVLGDPADVVTDGFRRLRARDGDKPALVLSTDRMVKLNMKGVSFMFDVMQGFIAQYNGSLYAAVAAFNRDEPLRAWIDYSARDEIVIYIGEE